MRLTLEVREAVSQSVPKQLHGGVSVEGVPCLPGPLLLCQVAVQTELQTILLFSPSSQILPYLCCDGQTERCRFLVQRQIWLD